MRQYEVFHDIIDNHTLYQYKLLMKYFYLELNALIEISNRLKKLNKNKAFFYTSLWALMEQYVNINSNNFGMIKHFIQNLEDSGIVIDYRDFFEILYQAFGINIDIAGKGLFKDINNAIKESKSFENLGKNMINNIMKLKTIRDSFNSFNILLEMIDKKIVNDNFSDNFKQSFVFNLLLNYIKKETNIHSSILEQKYNGTLNRYINAASKLYFNKQEIARNDHFDLEHFKYLQNDITHMVSDDKIMQLLDSKKVYSVSEFMEYCK